ncbi:MAG: GumC family protein, partial [Alphaproteobacteria bacterium]
MTVAQRNGRVTAPLPAEGDDAINLRQLLAILWRHKMIVIGTTMVITSITLLVVLQLTPLYVAEAQIVVEPPRTNVVDIDSVAQSMATDYYTNETQAAIIASRVLAEKVIDRLNLVDDPLFNPSLRPPSDGLLARLNLRNLRFSDLIPDSWRAALHDSGAGDALEEEDAPLTPEQERQLLRKHVIDVYLSRLSAVPSDSSRVITVGFVSEDPETAVRAANTAVEMYIADQVRAKSEQTELANAWLQNRAVELKERVGASARAVEEHRRDSGLVNVEGSSLLSQQLAELNSQLIGVRTQRAEAQARVKQVQRLLNSPGGVDSAAAVLQSPLIQRLREQEAEVVRKIAEMKTQYRDSHPKMILARSELQDLVTKIESELRKIAVNLGNELEIAQVRETNLEGEINRLENALDVQSDAEITLRALETELEANQKLYDTILARLKETDVQDASLLQADARIISFATTPAAPAFPRKRLVVGVAFVSSTILGMLIVLLIEYLDSGFPTRERLEAETGVAALSIVPGRSGRRHSHLAPYDDILERPNSLLSESLRTLRTALLLSNVDQPPRTVLVTSSVPGEGKTTTALALARTVAKHGQKCILIDGDLRKPS